MNRYTLRSFEIDELLFKYPNCKSIIKIDGLHLIQITLTYKNEEFNFEIRSINHFIKILDELINKATIYTQFLIKCKNYILKLERNEKIDIMIKS